MIQFEINGARQTVDPRSIEELGDLLRRAIQPGHVICVLVVNGLEIAESRLDEFDVGSIRTLEVRAAAPAELARQALGETREWIERICNVLDSIAQDYRLGREDNGTARLVPVVDSLHVLVGLLQGIHAALELDHTSRARLEAPWKEAENELKRSVEGLMEDLEAGDPVRLADRTGYALPQSLGRFREVLGGIPA